MHARIKVLAVGDLDRSPALGLQTHLREIAWNPAGELAE
jgi:hypothetical protein